MQKTCKQCSVPFEITQDDLAFYNKVSPVFNGVKYQIPEPAMCSQCRQQRRLAWRNERKLYKRKCAGTGKDILSVFSEDKPFVIYEPSYWFSDNWDALSYGRQYNFSELFIKQFTNLLYMVPNIARSVSENENCDFINQASWNKNCYLIFESGENEFVLYSSHIGKSRSSLDCYYSGSLELCYGCFDCVNCYNSRYLQSCTNCSDSWFLRDCIGCKNCFGSINLRNKEYYFFNQKLSKEDYFAKLQQLQLDKYENIQKAYYHFLDISKNFPVKNIHQVNCEDSDGDYLHNTKNCHSCFNVWNSQDCKYCNDIGMMKDCYDCVTFGVPRGVQQCYECHEVGDGCQNVYFSDKIISSYNIFYCHSLTSCNNCFACVGLVHKQYCIFNVQYTKEEYEKRVPQIIQYMQQSGEWGEFFPASASFFAYNETTAQDYFPLSKEMVEKRGWKWKEEISVIPEATKIIPAQKLPSTIAQVPDDVLNWAIRCEVSQLPFKIQKSELQLYRTMNLPLPRKHPEVRSREQLAMMRNPRILWQRNCMDCQKSITTSYGPERRERVLCEECYLKAVY